MADFPETQYASSGDEDTGMPLVQATRPHSQADAAEAADAGDQYSSDDFEEDDTDVPPGPAKLVLQVYDETVRRLLPQERRPGTAARNSNVAAQFERRYAHWAHTFLLNQHMTNFTFITILLELKSRKDSLLHFMVQRKLKVHGSLYRMLLSMFSVSTMMGFAKSLKTAGACMETIPVDGKEQYEPLCDTQNSVVPLDLKGKNHCMAGWLSKVCT